MTEMFKLDAAHLAEINKEVIREMIESVEQNGFVSQADFFADQTLNHGLAVNREAIRAVLRDIVMTFPDVRFELLGMIAGEDWVVMRCFFNGTHRGMSQHPFVHEGLLTGIAPTGKSVRVQHIHMFRLDNGQIIEHWANRDDVGMMRQLGLMV